MALKKFYGANEGLTKKAIFELLETALDNEDFDEDEVALELNFTANDILDKEAQAYVDELAVIRDEVRDEEDFVMERDEVSLDYIVTIKRRRDRR